MKLSFSTIGCPDWSFGEIFSAAKDLGYDAIEIRGLQKEMYAPKIREFTPAHINETAQKLSSAGLSVSMFTSNAVIGDPAKRAESFAEACDYIDLAERIKTPFVRLMISPNPHPEAADLDFAAGFYSEICAYAETKNVTPLIETNGVLADSRVMRSFIASVTGDNKGVLWDINHPKRFFNESAGFTFANIGEYVKYMHIKDSVETDKKTEYRLMGKGDLPVSEAVALLKNAGYSGFLSLEWTKRWCPSLDEAGIVFVHYINYIKGEISKL